VAKFKGQGKQTTSKDPVVSGKPSSTKFKGQGKTIAPKQMVDWQTFAQEKIMGGVDIPKTKIPYLKNTGIKPMGIDHYGGRFVPTLDENMEESFQLSQQAVVDAQSVPSLPISEPVMGEDGSINGSNKLQQFLLGLSQGTSLAQAPLLSLAKTGKLPDEMVDPTGYGSDYLSKLIGDKLTGGMTSKLDAERVAAQQQTGQALQTQAETVGANSKFFSPYNAGSTVGNMLDFALGYGAFGGAVEGAKGVVGLGSKLGTGFLSKMAPELAKDIIIGTPMNFLKATGNGLEGADLGKDMALNFALDVVTNTLLYGAGKVLKKITKADISKVLQETPEFAKATPQEIDDLVVGVERLLLNAPQEQLALNAPRTDLPRLNGPTVDPNAIPMGGPTVSSTTPIPLGGRLDTLPMGGRVADGTYAGLNPLPQSIPEPMIPKLEQPKYSPYDPMNPPTIQSVDVLNKTSVADTNALKPTPKAKTDNVPVLKAEPKAEVKVDTPKDATPSRYYTTQRPPGPGTIPKGATNVVTFDKRTYVPELGREAWGYVEYGKPLDSKVAADYELETSLAEKAGMRYEDGMVSFSAFVTDAQTGKKEVVTSLYRNKSDFIKDLRGNGYKVDANKVKPSDVYNFILDNTDANDQAWKYVNEVLPDGVDVGDYIRTKRDAGFDKASAKRKVQIERMEADIKASESKPPKPTGTDPFKDVDIYGDFSKTQAITKTNPELTPKIKEIARELLTDLKDSDRGGRSGGFTSSGEQINTSKKRATSPTIATLLDEFGYKYANIESALNRILNGKSTWPIDKRIEHMIDKMLTDGYEGFGRQPYEPDLDYVRLKTGADPLRVKSESKGDFLETADEDDVLDDLFSAESQKKARKQAEYEASMKKRDASLKQAEVKTEVEPKSKPQAEVKVETKVEPELEIKNNVVSIKRSELTGLSKEVDEVEQFLQSIGETESRGIKMNLQQFSENVSEFRKMLRDFKNDFSIGQGKITKKQLDRVKNLRSQVGEIKRTLIDIKNKKPTLKEYLKSDAHLEKLNSIEIKKSEITKPKFVRGQLLDFDGQVFKIEGTKDGRYLIRDINGNKIAVAFKDIEIENPSIIKNPRTAMEERLLKENETLKQDVKATKQVERAKGELKVAKAVAEGKVRIKFMQDKMNLKLGKRAAELKLRDLNEAERKAVRDMGNALLDKLKKLDKNKGKFSLETYEAAKRILTQVDSTAKSYNETKMLNLMEDVRKIEAQYGQDMAAHINKQVLDRLQRLEQKQIGDMTIDEISDLTNAVSHIIELESIRLGEFKMATGARLNEAVEESVPLIKPMSWTNMAESKTSMVEPRES